MTYFSSRVIRTKGELAPTELECSRLGPHRAVALRDLPSRFGPIDLARWAQSVGLQTVYVDNCWVRVPVTGVQLDEFLLAHSASCDLTDFEQLDGHVILEAEEF